MMKVSQQPYGLSEQYIVKFWHTNEEGFYRQTEETFYANSRSAHRAVEKLAIKELSKLYKNFSIINVTYQ
jgi:hypothetical protein